MHGLFPWVALYQAQISAPHMLSTLRFSLYRITYTILPIVIFSLLPSVTSAQSVQAIKDIDQQFEIWPDQNPMIAGLSAMAENIQQFCSKSFVNKLQCTLNNKMALLFAHLGVTRAQEIIADYYYFGVSTHRNKNTAMKWYLRAAKNYSALSQYKLYAQYSEQELEEAGVATSRMRWLQKSAETGLPLAWYEYGYHLHEGKSLRKDVAQSLTLLQRASQAGNLYATGLLLDINQINNTKFRDNASDEAINTSRSNGLLSDVEIERAFFDRQHDSSISADNADSKYNLAMQFHQVNGVYHSHNQAFHWMHKAAQENHRTAQLNLGIMYFNAIGTSKNDADAFRWISKAARHDYPIAQFFLATMYTDAVGVKKDITQAAELLKQAADGGIVSAHSQLAQLYESGEGIERNPDKAKAMKEYVHLNQAKLSEDFSGLVQSF